ncbi:hypothetical protein [Dyadobacter sp. CY323]|uniref:hypothetical protein n=1 Tax=Dyadobacter sp. CY323 TaxID=2907302 RepID=UPI001F435BA9|nr:hypothetical protein [Dyadobacter sp. CY323]MCE6987924.1 hypothetical protein [Dyadobacter sp. CY323]
MNTIQILSYFVFTATILLAGYSVFTLLRKLFSPEIRVTNRNTGKSVVLPKHTYPGLAQKLLEVTE